MGHIINTSKEISSKLSQDSVKIFLLKVWSSHHWYWHSLSTLSEMQNVRPQPESDLLSLSLHFHKIHVVHVDIEV
jgi:hypothetical protein